MAGDHEFFSLLVNKYVDIVFANEEEAKAFTGKEPEEALDIIAKMCSIAIVKVGARGSLIRKGTEEVRVEAVPVAKVVDTTGAGTACFAGGTFVNGLCKINVCLRSRLFSTALITLYHIKCKNGTSSCGYLHFQLYCSVMSAEKSRRQPERNTSWN